MRSRINNDPNKREERRKIFPRGFLEKVEVGFYFQGRAE